MEVSRYGSTILNLDIRWYVSDQLHDPATSIPGEEQAITIELEAWFDTFFMRRKADKLLALGDKEPRFFGCLFRSQVTIPTTLSSLLYIMYDLWKMCYFFEDSIG
jgi:hypothetical protein